MSTPREPDGGEFNFFAGRSRKMSRRRLEAARKKKRQTFLPDFHGLERRMMPATYLVNTTADSGGGSLRQAILDSDGAGPGPNTIDFGISGTGVQTISLLSALPSITVPVLIDGTSQTDYSGTPLIDLDGTSAGASADGLVLSSGLGGSTISALVINNFSGVGISITSTGNTVESSYIGTNATGSAAGSTPMAGGISVSAAGNIIGGASAGLGNVISGNAGNGITFTSAAATGNVVEGNLIGTDSTGENAVANTSDGVLFSAGGSNTIGGSTSADRNVIASEGLRGIEIDPGSNSNLVENNFIGTDLTGSVAMGAAHSGILDDGVSTSIIGNVIDASGNIGIFISGASTLVQGNLIGLNAAGTAALGNAEDGIAIETSGNTIGGTTPAQRNVIAGTLTGSAVGINVETGNDNLIEGNYVGTNAAGTGALPNGAGIAVSGGTGNTIGGATSTAGTGAGNLISGNANDGLDLMAGSSDTTVIGNIIGLDPTGTVALENGSSTAGGGIGTSSTGDTIGGTIAADRNIISGNYLRGITLGGTDEVVEGNYIGTDITGMIAIGNGLVPGYAAMYVDGTGDTIGGTVAGARNLLDGSGTEGIRLDTATSIDNLVAGNYIGVNAAGTGALLNHLWGVLISNGAAGNTIGGPTTAYANVISGNTDPGVDVDGAATTGDVVANDWIGTDAGGTGTLLNGSDALEITNGASALAQGSFTGNVLNQGTLGFFGAPSVITITGNYTQSSGGALDVDLGGKSLAGYDQLQVSGMATLAGTLNVDLLSSFTISPLEEFQIVTYGTVSGTFTTYNDPTGGTLYPGYGPTSLFLYSTPFELVTTTADSGAGSLRQAINTANGLTNNPTWIVFNIPTSDSGYSSGTWTISPLSALPNLSAEIVLDGMTQPGFTTTPIIVLSGASAGSSAAGVTVVAGGSGSTVRGFVVNGFAQDGIDLEGDSNTTIEGNFIGTNAAGTAAIANTDSGIEIDTDASGNTIGGTTPGAQNVISGNTTYGVEIDTGATGNVVEGSYIGTNVTGDVALGNSNGIWITSASNTIGGTASGAGDVIVANDGSGFFGGQQVYIGSSDNLVAGNLLGLSAAGVALSGATHQGVFINVASGNTIGGTTAAARNVISGNLTGIEVDGGSANVVLGNYIGTDTTGNVAIGNADGTAVELDGAANCTVGGTVAGAGNVLSGSRAGVYILNTTLGSGNVVEGNLIGTNAAGTAVVPNVVGVWIMSAGNTVGGTALGAGNVISGSTTFGGILIDGSLGGAASGNLVEGNKIGTDISGTLALGNVGGGVVAQDGASNNTIGGTTAGAANVISGNTDDGVELTGSGTTGNLVVGNFIGTNAAGTAAIANGTDGVEIDTGATSNTIGGLTSTPGTGAGNVISGNTGNGIEITGTGTSGNIVQGNIIGLNATGASALGNVGDGVAIDMSASNNTIGGATASARNIISANVVGVVIVNGASGNTVQGDYIGTDLTGMVAIGNLADGVVSQGTSDIIGGATNDGQGNPSPGTAPGNVISGNGSSQYPDNEQFDLVLGTDDVAAGNLIGLNATGTASLNEGAFACVTLDGGGDTIGGLSPNDRNVITGSFLELWSYGVGGFQVLNNYFGTDITGTIGLDHIGQIVSNGWGAISIENAGPNIVIGAPGAGNVFADSYPYPFYDAFAIGIAGAGPGLLIQGNKIGTDATGTAAIPNGGGIYIDDATGFLIGGTVAGAGNLISGSVFSAITINGTSGGTIEGNDIGTNAAGTAAIPNNTVGSSAIVLGNGASNITIGGTTAAARNVISGNDGGGILISDGLRRRLSGAGTLPMMAWNQGNTVEGNFICRINASGSGALPNSGSGIDVASTALDTVIGGTVTGAGNVISGNASNGILIDGTGAPADTPLYLKADGNTNNSTSETNPDRIPGSATLVGGVTYGTGVTGEAFQFSDTAGERVVVPPDNANNLAATALTLSA